MTLREIFNYILDYHITFEFSPEPWGVVIGVVMGGLIWWFIEGWYKIDD